MLKKITLYTCFIFFITNTFAKTEQSSASMNDPKAKLVMDKASEIYKQSIGIHAKFKQEIETPASKTSIKNGEIFLKGNKFKIKLSEQEIYCNEKSVWTYLKDVNEVQVNDYEPDPSDISPSNMFNIYQKDFYYIKIQDEVVNGQSCNVIDLTPKDKNRSYFKVRLWINKQTNILSRIKIFDKNGYRYTYTILSVNNNVKLEDSVFNFEKNLYPGVRIEDLRF
ncbi:MAG: outer membrane lipoprotein carrier protein LolA [Chitinophagales bacterium]|nr:outer membrane lipoprotein carrier protein LolA [Chitinophagales bacterium]MCZ2393741.1 outer membrane lipoprotein carrier protein LolA [Chitinophagales bacterium]